MLAARSGLDLGLPGPRPAKPLLLAARGQASQDLLPSAKLGRRALVAGHKGGLVPWDGVPRGLAVGGRDPWGKPRTAACCFYGAVCVSPPPPDRPAAPAPLPLSSRPSQRPRCLQRGVEKSHPGLVNHPRVTRSGFRPWKEMAAFFHCMGSRQGLGSSERGRGHPASLSVGGSDLGTHATGRLGCRVKECSCELTSPGRAMGPDWHLSLLCRCCG